MSKRYSDQEELLKSMYIRRDEQRLRWFEHLNRLRATARYKDTEEAVDNRLHGYEDAVDDLRMVLEKNPPANVEEVRESTWLIDGNTYECFACKRDIVVDGGTARMNYCNHCGAKNVKEAK